jgi:hypothetical protein
MECNPLEKNTVDSSLDWLKGQSTGNHRFSHEDHGGLGKFHVICPLNQSSEIESLGVMRP